MPRRSKRNSRDEDDENEVEAEFDGDEREIVNNNTNDDDDDQQDASEDDGDDNDDDDDNDNDDDDNDDDENQRSHSRSGVRRSRNQRKRMKVMSESGQTDEERRELRSKQRKLFSKMTDATTDVGEKMGDVDSEIFQSVRKENNKLWKKVVYTREAVLDGDNVDFISERANRQIDKLISVPRYAADRLSQKVREKCSITIRSQNTFDWKTFGLEVGSCFNSLPAYCSFLNGPINAEYTPKQRKKQVRRKVEEDDAEEEEVDTVNQQKKGSKDSNKLSAVEKQIQTLQKTLKKRDEQEKSKLDDLALKYEGIAPETMDDVQKKKFLKRVKKSNALSPCALQFVVNPQSFTQTVENLFGLSFAVKKGDAEVGVRSLENCKEYGLGTVPGPYVKLKPRGPQGPARQAIISFNMQDWRDLKDAFNIEKGDIPHRGKSKRNNNTATVVNDEE